MDSLLRKQRNIFWGKATFNGGQNMIYAAILAGGIGSRMGSKDKPKQYLNIGGKPIIIHTVEKFCLHTEFRKIFILCPKEWVEHTKGLIKKYIGSDGRIEVLEGGSVRNETIMKAVDYIENAGDLKEDTILVTHDAVRPFVTYRMIEENIRETITYGACDTVIPATDTIVESTNGDIISAIPNRSAMYQGQTPQSFKAKKLKKLYNELSEDEKAILTDAAKIFVLKGEPVKLVHGETSNIKITYPYDIAVAEALLKGEVKC